MILCQFTSKFLGIVHSILGSSPAPPPLSPPMEKRKKGIQGFFSVVKLTFENQTTIMPHIPMELLMLAVKSFETTIVIKFLNLKRGEHNELFKESAVNGLIKRK